MFLQFLKFKIDLQTFFLFEHIYVEDSSGIFMFWLLR